MSSKENNAREGRIKCVFDKAKEEISSEHDQESEGELREKVCCISGV